MLVLTFVTGFKSLSNIGSEPMLLFFHRSSSFVINHRDRFIGVCDPFLWHVGSAQVMQLLSYAHFYDSPLAAMSLVGVHLLFVIHLAALHQALDGYS